MTAYDTAAFRALQRTWYAKLRDTGFVDVEEACQAHYDGRLPRDYARGMPTEQYYRLAGWWLHDRVWASRRDARVWEMHADGMTYRDIAHACRISVGYSPARVCALVQDEVPRMVAHYNGRSA